MKRVLFIVLSSLMIGSAQLGYCNSQDPFSGLVKEIELLQKQIEQSASENGQVKNPMISASVQFLEGKVLNKLKQSQSRLAKYQEQLRDAAPELNDMLSKKIEATEKKIHSLNDILATIETLKAKIVK